MKHSPYLSHPRKDKAINRDVHNYNGVTLDAKETETDNAIRRGRANFNPSGICWYDDKG